MVATKLLNISKELKAEKDKIVKPETHDLSYFLDNIFLLMMVLKICLFINLHVLRFRIKSTEKH